MGTSLLRYFKASGDTAKIPSHIDLVGGARATGHPRKLDCEIFADCPSAIIGPLENFRLYDR